MINAATQTNATANRPNQAPAVDAIEMLFITHTGLEIVSRKYYAYFDGGQFEISQQAKMNIDWALSQTGRYVVTKQWFDLFDGEKYEY